jgi:hypothetical protein
MEINEEDKVFDGRYTYSKDNYINNEYPKNKARARIVNEFIEKSGFLSRIYDDSENEQYTWDLIRGLRGNQEAALDNTEDLEIW